MNKKLNFVNLHLNCKWKELTVLKIIFRCFVFLKDILQIFIIILKNIFMIYFLVIWNKILMIRIYYLSLPEQA